MKCPNCGAELQTNPDQEIRFCQYCGHKIEIVDEDPETMAGSVYRLGKQYLKQNRSTKVDVARVKAEAKVAEAKAKAEERKTNTIVALITGALGVMLVIAMIIWSMSV